MLRVISLTSEVIVITIEIGWSFGVYFQVWRTILVEVRGESGNDAGVVEKCGNFGFERWVITVGQKCVV